MDNLERIFAEVGLSTAAADIAKPVPNVQPIYNTTDYRIAIIGEAPGENEAVQGKPFVGASGWLLDKMLNKANINRAACFVGNVCQHRPPGNDITNFAWDGPQVQAGLTQLAKDLETFKPNLCVLLGNTPLKAAQGHLLHKVTSMRGTVFRSTEPPMKGLKCLATYHPAAVLRNDKWMQVLLFDLMKARRHGINDELHLPSRQYDLNLTADEICTRLNELSFAGHPVSLDIEGGLKSMSCISFAPSPNYGFIVPLTNEHGGSYWGEADELKIWQMLARFLGSRTPKILQNSLYDNFVLTYGYRCPIMNVAEDTMLKHWEMYSELEKSLGFQASLYTEEPYYKFERTESGSLAEFWTYCCKDSAVTYEISQKLDADLFGASKTHYRFNMSLLPLMLYMELRGIKYDAKAAAARRQVVLEQLAVFTHRLNQCFDAVPTKDAVREACCYKRDSRTLKKGQDPRILNLLDYELTESLHGELSLRSGVGINVESPKQLAELLYKVARYPMQRKKVPGKRTESVSTDAKALLQIYKSSPDPIIRSILKMKALSTEYSTLAARADGDGRIRSAYNLVGTETGRLTCYTSPTGSGYNLQTATKSHRKFMRADDGYWFFQLDLAGADGWTVAAHCARLGDPTMLEDYKAGIKPAKVLALLYEYGPAVNQWSRQELKQACSTVDTADWRYFAYKRVQHGTNYGMGERTMAVQVLADSYKMSGTPVYVEPKFCRQIQELYLSRYGAVQKWHAWVKEQLLTKGYLVSASGHRRWFFGRRDDPATLKSALSNEPQENTTYALNLAAYWLWHDPENRMGDRLHVEPLHQVHDALCGQFRKERTEWAVTKLRAWFNNTLMIAGQALVIPFDGGYGPSWGELTEGEI